MHLLSSKQEQTLAPKKVGGLRGTAKNVSADRGATNEQRTHLLGIVSPLHNKLISHNATKFVENSRYLDGSEIGTGLGRAKSVYSL